MANEQNLISIGDRSTEEQREICSKGGKASVAVRRKKKLFKERLRDALDAKVTNDVFKKQLRELGMDDENATNEDLLVSSLLVSVYLKNDINALEMILSYIGESPKEKRAASRTKTQNALNKAKTEALKRMDGSHTEVEDDGFIEALEGKVDNTEWDESEN